MNLRSISLSVALLASSAWAQGQDYQAMAKAMEQAQAAASKPGDEKLTSAALRSRFAAARDRPPAIGLL